MRRAAAYALGRIPRGGPLDAAQHASLLSALRDLEAETRATAARAAGKQGLDAEDLAPLLDPPTEPDWRVHVEAARALAEAPRGSALISAAIGAAAERLRESHTVADARWAHPLVQLFESAAQLKLSRDAMPAPRDLSAPTPAATAAIRCAAADARDRSANALLETPQCAVGLEVEWRSRFRTASLAAELAGDHTESAAGLLLFKALHDPDPRVRSAAAGSASLAFAPVLIALLDDSDPYVVGSAASTLAKDPQAARAALSPATRAAARFSLPPGPSAGDPRADTLSALGTLFAASHEHAAADSSATPPASANSRAPVPAIVPEAALGRPGSGPRAHTLILTTSAGELRVHLFADDGEAPLTSVALSMLANRGFYDGLSFHRVVPDFVAQGGDPLGDGEGGPGFALPDEHTALHFTRGTLGIATSGPETGGSQFFLCHGAQPHLDGRYTIAGQLEGGEDVLDALQVGDVILHARAE